LLWNACIERWMYISNTDWSRKFNVKGYYVRIAPIETDGVSRFQETESIKVDGLRIAEPVAVEEMHA